MMSDTTNSSNGNLAAKMGVDPNNAPYFLTKDYRTLLNKIDDKKGKV